MKPDQENKGVLEGDATAVQQVYLGLGSSLGDRIAHLRDAARRLDTPEKGTAVVAVSSIYETPHMGLEAEDATRYPPHLNCVVQIATRLTPQALLERVRVIETEGMRQRKEHWGPRTIDIDILLYASIQTTTPELTLPHPGIPSRIFVLKPLLEIDPDLVLPDGQSARALLETELLQQQPIERLYSGETLR